MIFSCIFWWTPIKTQVFFLSRFSLLQANRDSFHYLGMFCFVWTLASFKTCFGPSHSKSRSSGCAGERDFWTLDWHRRLADIFRAGLCNHKSDVHGNPSGFGLHILSGILNLIFKLILPHSREIHFSIWAALVRGIISLCLHRSKRSNIEEDHPAVCRWFSDSVCSPRINAESPEAQSKSVTFSLQDYFRTSIYLEQICGTISVCMVRLEEGNLADKTCKSYCGFRAWNTQDNPIFSF